MSPSSTASLIRTVNLNIDPGLLEQWPDLAVKAFRVDNLSEAGVAKVKRSSTDQLQQSIAQLGIDVQNISSHPIIDLWRNAFSTMGLKSSTFKSSPEALARRFMKHGPIETPLHLVNCYCDASVTHLAPLGAYDLNRLPGCDGGTVNVELRRVRRTDSFSPIGGRAEDFPLSESVTCYAVADEVICWAFNCRDSATTCLTSGTRSALYVGEALNFVQHGALDEAIRSVHHDLNIPGIVVGPIVTISRDHPIAEIVPLDL